MADTTQTAAFPLGTVSYSDGGGSSDGSGVDNAGGASGSSSGGINISHGAMIAIILVVVLVAVFGSEYTFPAGFLFWRLLDRSIHANSCSRLCCFVLPRQEA